MFSTTVSLYYYIMPSLCDDAEMNDIEHPLGKHFLILFNDFHLYACTYLIFKELIVLSGSTCMCVTLMLYWIIPSRTVLTVHHFFTFHCSFLTNEKIYRHQQWAVNTIQTIPASMCNITMLSVTVACFGG